MLRPSTPRTPGPWLSGTAACRTALLLTEQDNPLGVCCGFCARRWPGSATCHGAAGHVPGHVLWTDQCCRRHRPVKSDQSGGQSPRRVCGRSGCWGGGRRWWRPPRGGCGTSCPEAPPLRGAAAAAAAAGPRPTWRAWRPWTSWCWTRLTAWCSRATSRFPPTPASRSLDAVEPWPHPRGGASTRSHGCCQRFCGPAAQSTWQDTESRAWCGNPDTPGLNTTLALKIDDHSARRPLGTSTRICGVILCSASCLPLSQPFM